MKNIRTDLIIYSEVIVIIDIDKDFILYFVITYNIEHFKSYLSHILCTKPVKIWKFSSKIYYLTREPINLTELL